jgi:hypothetical protein
MKFPITRESLQAIDQVKEKKEKDDIAIQTHINSLIHGICQEIENLMLWEMPKQGGICQAQHLIDSQKNAHEKIMSDKRFIWGSLRNIRQTFRGSYLDTSESILIQRLVEKLKETFIGCDIIIDPLKTYLIIDWS